MPAGFGAGFAEGFEEQTAVVVIMKNVFAAVATIKKVIDGAFVLDAKFAGHERRLKPGRRMSRECTLLRTDPSGGVGKCCPAEGGTWFACIGAR